MNSNIEEVEVKFFLENDSPVKEAVLRTGGVSLGRFFELNIRYDDKNESIKRQKSLLRLRKDQKSRLTFKAPPDIEDARFKILRELEIEVNDFETTQHILNALGFFEVQRYEKYRETFIIGETQLLMDAMPYGDFLEIEGEKGDIMDLAGKIGMKWEDRILANYLEIFERIKSMLNLAFNDVAFGNFTTISADSFSSIIRTFQAGKP
jgi:adenylate cyclase, class 2